MTAWVDEKIQTWSDADVAIGQRNLDCIMPDFYSIILETYNQALGVHWNSVPKEIEENEKFILERIATGKFDRKYQ